jgi:CubicO group peptidase (beta-lactamase class C family)
MLIFASLEANMVVAKDPPAQISDDQITELTPENLENFLDEFVPLEMETAHVPGLVITVVRRDEVVLAKGYGFADLQNRIPMTPKTNIRAGSVSKSILATGVIKLVEQGVLEINAPVTDYISDLNLEDEFGSASTIGQLLTHMSGYPDNLVQSHSPDLDGWEPLGDVLGADLPPRAFAPGTVSAYSDWNFSLLGYAIEGATGKPYETVMVELLFNPIGMNSTTYIQPLPDEIFDNLATGYGWNYGKNRFDTVPHDFVRMSPGIALVTNVEDMGAYLRMFLNEGALDGNQLFGDETLALLLERQGAAHPLSRGWSYGFVENTFSGRRVLYKDGNGIGFASRVVLMPDQDLGIFVSTNHRNLGEGLWPTQAAMMATRSLVSAILENFVPESETETHEVQQRFNQTDQLHRFMGHYQKAGISRNDFFKLEGMLDNVDVKDNGDGTLKIGSGIYQEV